MDIILITLASIIFTSLAIPLTIKTAKKFGLVDDPKKRPHPAHVQNRVVPRAGGLAIYLGIIFASLLFLPLETYLLGIFAGLTLLLIIGILDDKLIKFSPYLRLFLIFLAAGFTVIAGVEAVFITNPLYAIGLSLSLSTTPILHLNTVTLLSPISLSHLLALLLIVAFTQIINWSKGVDGQMPGITLVTAITLGLLSLKFFYQGDTEQLTVAKLSFIVAGSSFAFLIFNWHPAKIFPGFSGSTILAYMLATLSILSGAKVATALLVLAVPTIDFAYTFWRRVLQGKSPVWGDRGHLHHRLLDLGWSHSQISLFYITVSAMLGAVALLSGTGSKIFAAAIVAIIFFGFILWINSFGDLSKPPGPGNG